MGRLPDHKRITVEEFPPKDQNLVRKLAYPINSFIEQTRNLFNKNIDFLNLNQEIVTLSVSVDANGLPIVDTKFKSNLRKKVQGVICIRAFNINTPTTFVVATPFISFTQDGNIVLVASVTGLQANTQYNLILLTIGS